MDPQPGEVGQRLLDTLFGHEWELTKSLPVRTSGRRRMEPEPAPYRMLTIRRSGMLR